MRKVHVFLIAIILTFCFSFRTYAYEYNGWVFSNPLNITYSISSSAAPYINNISSYSTKWNNMPEINISLSENGNGNIVFTGDFATNTGAYAITYHYSNTSHYICLYMDFSSLSEVRKNETIVHEVGHALGLAHCAVAYNNISVMRATGFNDIAAPLMYDGYSIANLY